MINLNLGCGNKIQENCINVDKYPYNEDVMVYDLNKYPYPFEDNSIDEIYCRHTLEHLDNVENTMMEMNRILKENATAEIIVPYFTSAGSFEDITHKHFFTYHSFNILQTSPRYIYNGYVLYTKEIRLIFGKRFQIWNYLFEPLTNKFPEIYEGSILRINPARELRVVLQKRKKENTELIGDYSRPFKEKK